MWTFRMGRLWSHWCRSTRRNLPASKTKFSVQPFSKGWRFPKAAPLVALRRGRNLPNDTKRSGREGPTARWAVGPRGTLTRGSPQDAVLHLTPTNNNRASEKKRQTLRLAGAVFRFGFRRGGSCRNFCEIAAAGTSAGGQRAAFPYFWVAPEAQRSWDFAFCGKRPKALPLESASLLKKAGPKT